MVVFSSNGCELRDLDAVMISGVPCIVMALFSGSVRKHAPIVFEIQIGPDSTSTICSAHQEHVK